MSGIKDRLLAFLKHLGMGQANFEKATGLSNGLINNMKDNLSTKSLNKISAKFPQLNSSWLLTGEGNMLTDGRGDNSIIHFTNVDLGKEIGAMSERLIRIEAHLEVYENAIAGLQSKTHTEFMRKVGALRSEVSEAVNRRFSELQMKTKSGSG